MSFVKRRLSTSAAAWKVLANSVMVMPMLYPGGKSAPSIAVFVTGDNHNFIAGEVRVDDEDRRPVATEFVGGSISSWSLGDVGAEATIDGLRRANPWGADSDFDHHGYGVVEASQEELKCRLRRLQTVKTRSRAALSDGRFSYRIGLDHPSLLA